MLRFQPIAAILVPVLLLAWLGGCSDSSSPGAQDPSERRLLAGGSR